MFPHIDKVAGFIREAAAAEILPRFERLEAADIQEKGPGDLVTIADTEAERVLTRRFKDLLPGVIVVGEEATAADPAGLDRPIGDEAALENGRAAWRERGEIWVVSVS